MVHSLLVDEDGTDLSQGDGDIPAARFKQTLVLARTLSLILLYFILSIGLTFYQRALLKDLHFPLSIVLCHLILKFMLAVLCRCVVEWHTGWPQSHTHWKKYISKFAPIGITSGLDVGLSNWGLELIRISLYTMTKSTTIIFILIFSLFFKLQKRSWSLVVIVLLIATGLSMFTYEASEFNALGFSLVLTAAFTSGLRWTMAQLLMQHSESGHQNPLDMVYHVQPWMILSVLPFAAFFEGPKVSNSCLLSSASDFELAAHSALKVGAGAFVAFAMELSEYLVVLNTSSLTLSIAGVLKEILTVVLAVEWEGDRISTINVIGLMVCIGGISAHVARLSSKTTSPVRSFPSSNRDMGFGYEMSAPLLSNGEGIPNLRGNDTEEEDSEEDSDILYILSQWDRPISH